MIHKRGNIYFVFWLA